MKEKKRKFLKLFLGAEVTVIVLYYLMSSSGLQALKRADYYNSQLMHDITSLETELSTLEQEVEERTTNPFYKEMIARQELQMGYENEIVYILPKKG